MTTGTELARLLDSLNKYANLLLVFVTGIYVWLTWRNVQALQRASLREREQRHWADIKRYVVRPVIKWLDSEVVPKLKGDSPLVTVNPLQVARAKPAFGEPMYDFGRQLNHTLTEPQAIFGDLFTHARQIHFPQQLGEIERFVGTLRQVVAECAVFARDCADRIASTTSLQRVPVHENVREAADSDELVAVCLRDFFLGKPIAAIAVNSPPSGFPVEIRDLSTGRLPLGRGRDNSIEAWAKRGDTLIREELAKSGLPERIGRLLNMARNVRMTIERLKFSYDLQGECEYIGGRSPGPLKAAWRRLRYPGKS